MCICQGFSTCLTDRCCKVQMYQQHSTTVYSTGSYDCGHPPREGSLLWFSGLYHEPLLLLATFPSDESYRTVAIPRHYLRTVLRTSLFGRRCDSCDQGLSPASNARPRLIDELHQILAKQRAFQASCGFKPEHPNIKTSDANHNNSTDLRLSVL